MQAVLQAPVRVISCVSVLVFDVRACCAAHVEFVCVLRLSVAVATLSSWVSCRSPVHGREPDTMPSTCGVVAQLLAQNICSTQETGSAGVSGKVAKPHGSGRRKGRAAQAAAERCC